MKTNYVSHKFKPASLERIAQCNDIIDRYKGLGLDLTLRQLYYRLVATGIIENTNQSYKRLGKIVNKGRLAGLIDWNSIVDRTRGLKRNNHFDSPLDAVQVVRNVFAIDKWADQPNYVEVWIEKDALIGVIDQVCRDLDVSFFSCRGYISQSAMWRSAHRVRSQWRDVGDKRKKRDAHIIHLADHDPSGMDMTHDIQNRFNIFWANANVNRIALNMPQVRQYDPPPNPTKPTDSRSGGYISQFGQECWELDALEPMVISDLIREEVLPLRDESLWDAKIEEEEAMKETLDKVLDRLKEEYEE